MISRTLRSAVAVAGFASLLALANGAGAFASSVHPAPTCVEPSPCAPISPITVLVILVKVFSLLGHL